MTELNIPLLRKAVEWVEEQDALENGQWDQSVFVANPSCGTVYCVAGYVGQLMDSRFERTECFEDEHGVLLHVENVATAALGLNKTQADFLFSEDNTAEDVRRIAERFAGGKL